MPGPINRSIRRPIAGMFVALVVLGGAELLLRHAGVPDPGLYEGDPRTVWWLRASMDRDVPHIEQGTSFRVTTNTAHMRGPTPPETGGWTLALGCSTTFGWGVDVEEAWPAMLSRHLGEPVINGGVPGWSTHQAVFGIDRLLQHQPTRVLLAYGVRDAQAAVHPDSAVSPTSWLRRTNLAGLIRSTRPQASPTLSVGGQTTRVPPEAYTQNLRILLARLKPAEVVLIHFPQQEPNREWRDAMESIGPVIAPQLSPDHFFERDPIHLTASGHQALAEFLAGALQRQ